MTTIKVIGQPEVPFKEGSAREQWWNAVTRYDGKSVEALGKAVKRKPPHKTISGKVEPVGGWLGYFQREGLIQVVGD